MIKRVNFNHISLSDSDLKKYESLYRNDCKVKKSNPSPEQFKEKIAKGDLTQQEQLPQLAYAEMLAIHRYTGVFTHEDMNNMLRGIPVISEQPLTDILVDIAVASHGLNKIPDIELPTVIRCQSEHGLENMKKLAAQGGVEQVPGFISTAYQPRQFGRVRITFTNTRGKSISAISEDPKEREYLIPPTTQIRFTGYEFKNGKHLFTAEGANILLDQEYSKKKQAAQTAREKIDADIRQTYNQLSSQVTPEAQSNSPLQTKSTSQPLSSKQTLADFNLVEPQNTPVAELNFAAQTTQSASQPLSAEQLNLIAQFDLVEPQKNPIAHPNYLRQSNNPPVEQPYYPPDPNYKSPYNNSPVEQPYYPPDPNYKSPYNNSPVEQPYYPPDPNYKGPYNDNPPVEQPYYPPDPNYKGPYNNNSPVEQPYYPPDPNYKSPYNNNPPVEQPYYVPDPNHKSPYNNNLPVEQPYYAPQPIPTEYLQPSGIETAIMQPTSSAQSQLNQQNTNKIVKDFLEKSVKTLYTCGVITLGMLEKYINNELPKDAQQDKKLESLSIEDRLVLCVNKLTDKLGLKSISEKLENQISQEGFEIINNSQPKTFAKQIKDRRNQTKDSGHVL